MKTVTIKNWRTENDVLVQPMTEKDLKDNVSDDGSISAKIKVSFNDLVSNDLEWFNDYVSESITGSEGGLVDIFYSVAGRTTNDEVIVKVSAVVDFDNV